MKKISRNVSLNQRLAGISLAVFIPMILVMTYLLASLTNATSAYAQITKSVSYANMYARDFKERMDYSMYLAVIGKRDMEELGDGETTVNGILTVNPYKYIDELEETCDKLSYMATVDSNRNQIKRLKNSLKSLKGCVKELETAIDSGGAYEDKMNYLNENIYMLTSLIQEGIQDYIYVETTNYANVKAELDTRNTRTFVICIWISVAAIVLALFLTMKAAKSVTKPIQKLCRMTQQVAEGDFTVQTKESNTDEIAVLTRSFNDMTQEIGGLVEDIKQQQKNLRIAETKLLQAQINPHFLYNTLDAIVWLAEENRKDEVVSMVTALSDFFRTTLSKGRDFITVREEQSHIESYLKIQQFRYQDIKSLSGGNQQKVIIGRWLLTNPDYLILDEPTRGIDIGTKTEIQKLVLDLADQGMAVTFISSEVEEMLRTCSRMGVLRDGKKVGEISGNELSQEGIMKAIAGGGDNE